MPLKGIYPPLGPLYYDFMGFDMGFLSLFLSLFALLLILPPQLIHSMKQMKDTALFQKVEGHQAHPPRLELVCFLFSSSRRTYVRTCIPAP